MRAHFASREVLWRDKFATFSGEHEAQYAQLVQSRDQQKRTYEALLEERTRSTRTS